MFLNLETLRAQAPDKDWHFDPKTSTLIPNYLGIIKTIKGKANIGDRELKKGSRIYNNDVVQTAEKSFVVIEMIDLTMITLGPKSDFSVEKWAYRTKSDREAVFSVIRGQWRALIKTKSKEEDQLKIKTSLVSMGVRGTELMVNVNNIDTKEITEVALLEGFVHIEGKNSETQKDLTPGEHVVYVKDQKGVENKERKLTPKEIKSYQEFTSPGILRLLDPEPYLLSSALNSSKTENIETVKDYYPSSAQKKEGRSLKEKLELLNSLREKNSK